MKLHFMKGVVLPVGQQNILVSQEFNALWEFQQFKSHQNSLCLPGEEGEGV